jgi:recombinational DNA repair ATPase RecF
MIQSFSIENFKSFRKATPPLAPLTLLIGANASGKSNAIEAIQLLSWLASGSPPADLFYAIREQELSLREGINDLAGSKGEITLGCEFERAGTTLSYLIFLASTEEGLRILREHLFKPGGDTLFDWTSKKGRSPAPLD